MFCYCFFFKENYKPVEIETETKSIKVNPGKLGIVLNWDSFEITDITKNAQRCFRKIEKGWEIISVDGEPVTKQKLLRKVKGREIYYLQCQGIRTKQYVTMLKNFWFY